MSSGKFDPMHQFEVHKLLDINLFGLDVSITNQSMWMMLSTLCIMILFIVGLRKRTLIPNKMQSFVEVTYDFIQDLVISSTGIKGKSLVPLIFTIFSFIAANNMLGLIPGSYTSTSQISLNFAMGLSVISFVICVGLYHHGLKFFTLFVPAGLPMVLKPFIATLELISFFARPFTLAIRLAANMAAGHILLKVFSHFAVMLASVFVAYAIVPSAVLFGINLLELLVAVLQAYIFSILTCVYLNDAINLH
ncbi:MAG: F0F1 ATP synthase subunit A [Proteobacteria bacterium]|nr:F0F1 ATP synthase subunit A [Pseudomonadota bacterium]